MRPYHLVHNNVALIPTFCDIFIIYVILHVGIRVDIYSDNTAAHLALNFFSSLVRCEGFV